jgi:hypothetical protein
MGNLEGRVSLEENKARCEGSIETSLEDEWMWFQFIFLRKEFTADSW